MTKFPFKTSVGRQREIVQMCAELGIEEQSWRSFPVTDGIDALKCPCCRLRLARWPGLALHAHAAIVHVLHPDLEAIPGIGLPGKRGLDGSCRFRLPRFDLQLLGCSVENQGVALCGDADITHLPA